MQATPGRVDQRLSGARPDARQKHPRQRAAGRHAAGRPPSRQSLRSRPGRHARPRRRPHAPPRPGRHARPRPRPAAGDQPERQRVYPWSARRRSARGCAADPRLPSLDRPDRRRARRLRRLHASGRAGGTALTAAAIVRHRRHDLPLQDHRGGAGRGPGDLGPALHQAPALKVLRPAGYMALHARDHPRQRLRHRSPRRRPGGRVHARLRALGQQAAGPTRHRRNAVPRPVQAGGPAGSCQLGGRQASKLIAAELGQRISVRPAMVMYGPTIPWVVMKPSGRRRVRRPPGRQVLPAPVKDSHRPRLDAGQIAMVFAAAAGRCRLANRHGRLTRQGHGCARIGPPVRTRRAGDGRAPTSL